MKVSTKRSQDGSAGGLVVVVVLAFLLWWQWDWISGLFGGAGGGPAQLLDYRCDRQSDGRMRFDGSVSNTSEKPLELKAVTALYDSSGKKSDYSEATVRPVPLQPGKTGTFRGDTPPLPDGGGCKLDGFTDLGTGKAVGFRR
jgi:hypothetical protein